MTLQNQADAALDYQGLSFDTVCQMALDGDEAANEELARRRLGDALPAENSRDAESDNKPRTTLYVRLRQLGPLIRRLSEKIVMIFEAAAIILFMYAAYYLFTGLYFEIHDWDLIGQAVSYTITLIGVIILSKFVNTWLQQAWEDRPLTIWLVFAAVLFWVAEKLAM